MSDPWRRITEALDEIERGPVVEGGWQALHQIAARAEKLSTLMRDREDREVRCWHSARRIETGGEVCIRCGAVVNASGESAPPPLRTEVRAPSGDVGTGCDGNG